MATVSSEGGRLRGRAAAAGPLPWVALALVGLALGSALLVAPAPTYDPWMWLLWGREVAGGALEHRGGTRVQAAAGRGVRRAGAARRARARGVGADRPRRGARGRLARVPPRPPARRATRSRPGSWRRSASRCAAGSSSTRRPASPRARCSRSRSGASRRGARGAGAIALGVRASPARCCAWRRGRSCSWPRSCTAAAGPATPPLLAGVAAAVLAAWFVPEWLGLRRSAALGRRRAGAEPRAAGARRRARGGVAARRGRAAAVAAVARGGWLAGRAARGSATARTRSPPPRWAAVDRARRGHGPGRLLRRAALRAAGRRAGRDQRGGGAGVDAARACGARGPAAPPSRWSRSSRSRRPRARRRMAPARRRRPTRATSPRPRRRGAGGRRRATRSCAAGGRTSGATAARCWPTAATSPSGSSRTPRPGRPASSSARAPPPAARARRAGAVPPGAQPGPGRCCRVLR